LRDRDLVRLHWPVGLRPAFDALFAIDDAMGDVVATSSQPALGAIRLAWWREALERLDQAAPPPEPRLQAAATELLPRGISGRALARLEIGWAVLLEESPQLSVADARGEQLFELGAQLLGSTDPALAQAGRLYARADLARRGYACVNLSGIGRMRFPKPLRPLTALAALAARDARAGGPPFEPEATPGRAARILSHRLFGTLA